MTFNFITDSIIAIVICITTLRENRMKVTMHEIPLQEIKLQSDFCGSS